jgi:hypothetical protein
MIESTGDTYQSSKFAKSLCASDPKAGKTTYLISSALGLLPWQKTGGIVDKPENLHVISFDANALGGVKRFLLETLGAPKEALNFKVYNLQEDFRRISVNEGDWDLSFYGIVQSALERVRDRCNGGSPVLLISSLTGLAQGCERALAGPVVMGKKGAGMDMAKWAAFAHQLGEVRNFAQIDSWHCLWEAHIHKPMARGQGNEGDDMAKESIQVSGKTGQNFAYNVEQVFRIRRAFGQKSQTNPKVDLTYLDTAPSLDFIAGGRNFTEALQPKEYDPTEAFKKLGLIVGHWNSKSAPPKPVAKPAVKAVAK